MTIEGQLLRASSSLDEANARIKTLEAQNKELLTALKEISTYPMGTIDHKGCIASMWAIADVAIAKAGETP